MPPRCRLAIVIGATLTAGVTASLAQEQTTTRPADRLAESPRELQIESVLVIHGIGRSGRVPIHTDAIEDLIVHDRWKTPQPGDVVALPDGTERKWEVLDASPDGSFRDERLAGGYALATVPSLGNETMLLEAAGHSVVYVNDVPRGGDPYSWGFVRLPVQLRRGDNELLFACGRGSLRAKLVAPSRPISLSVADATAPDLLIGQTGELWATVVVINTTAEPLWNLELSAACGEAATTTTRLPPVPALGLRKVPFQIAPPRSAGPGTQAVELTLRAASPRGTGAVFDRATLELRVLAPSACHKRTFISDIDGSVQYFAVQPAIPPEPASAPASGQRLALILTLHGAGVEATGQAAAYAPKTWANIVAPTNRRPFGFDWEDWGRLDALEVLAEAERIFDPDPQRVYLTGHSMGGHGTWQVGAHYPGRFAAIAPSAGWISFWSYTAGPGGRPEPRSPVEQILQRAANVCDTLGLARNYLHHGVYVLHGDQDDNVPAEQARTMRDALAKFHPNWAYYERPGAGHWWSNACVDWPPLMAFLQQNTRPAVRDVRRVEFVTANPAVSARCDWVIIEQQVRSLEFSRVVLELDPAKRLFAGSTENVARFTVDLRELTLPPASPPATQPVLSAHAPLTLKLDGAELDDVPWPADGLLRLARIGDQWALQAAEDLAALAARKNPRRAGPFKEAFQHRMQFVYGTQGDAAENAWAAAKARYDAEVWWVRGNGSVDVLADVEFDSAAEPDRSVVLYGNADTNAVWARLLAGCPLQVRRGRALLGDRALAGEDLAVLAVYPRPGSTTASVAMIAGTGLPGLRLTERVPYFVSGVELPDWIVLGAETLRQGTAGVRAAGYFDNHWRIDPAQSAWSE
ncbi:MAG: prolyl oligopeptidase family serine peptidase [Planctomycetota bacterium]